MTTITVPAGTYRVGDPCYSIPSDRWMEWLNAADFTNAVGHLLAAPLDGHLAVAFHTEYGDGSYPGTDGFSYPVDAGLIGLVPAELTDLTEDPERSDLWTLVTFDGPTECSRDTEGTITLGTIVIATGDTEDDDEWSDDDDDDDEDG